jgi:hypothetical protein
VNYNFFGGSAQAFEREKNWGWRFVLIFCFFFIKEKESKRIIEMRGSMLFFDFFL